MKPSGQFYPDWPSTHTHPGNIICEPQTHTLDDVTTW